MSWNRVAISTITATLLAVGLAGCTGIDQARTFTSIDGPLSVSVVNEGRLTHGGATWIMTIEHSGLPGWGAVSYDAACDGPLNVRLWAAGDTDQFFDRPPQEAIDVTSLGPPLVWRPPSTCDEPPSMQLLQTGQSTRHSWRWDATLLNETSNTFEEAPQGTYVWEAVWHGRHADADPDATDEEVQLTPQVVQGFSFTR